jgi:hypothetical protein
MAGWNENNLIAANSVSVVALIGKVMVTGKSTEFIP